MPFAPQVASDFAFGDFFSFTKSWNKCAFGQIATSFGFSLSSKRLTGGVSYLEISFLFRSSTALSGHFLLNKQYRRPNAISF
ncbi:hypothetical protein RHGRI_020584 [Rhododendron griersonianum]|uniref:Uncharacterized protein n=1 Tax=Rhododendron griersonianum TaxID=479676 RepID=A0AAV6JK65_9ERIC|nr:hypothetical protein RHGRI_020584 [Rhododendron griersonianum]KAG5540408.1 hypothetical protein RHGRI_020584 [Rhododendron griersonianum]KAG5540409.1 hypothetical protein RHGRI_020584 [Rhododendron griersonianum]KAG5540410.1 hypothetical protein RHGRI_020584 [Rhododendron griersonianum]KAG5540411.1 hypothetical protein RHGRI_020584 [Rhododendron griersonianum]